MMSPADYEKWKLLQNAASDAMLLADQTRKQGDLARWDKLFRKAIQLQYVANEFARTTTQTSDETDE